MPDADAAIADAMMPFAFAAATPDAIIATPLMMMPLMMPFYADCCR
jgi:hypothetical protein